MQIFALETSIPTLKAHFLSTEEKEIRTVFYHWLPFAIVLLRALVLTAMLAAVVWGLLAVHMPTLWIVVPAVIIWLAFVFFPLLRAFIDWRYDFILITTDKIIVVDQSSIFRQAVTPISLENFVEASTETQYWNLFSFGILHLHLTEGSSQEIVFRFIPDAQGVASTIADTVTQFQRRKDLRRYGDNDDDERPAVVPVAPAGPSV